MQTFFGFYHVVLVHVEEDCVQPRPQGPLPWLQNWPPKPGKRLVDEVGLRDKPIERLYIKGKGLDRGTVPPRLPV